jgi:hypothetical protein
MRTQPGLSKDIWSDSLEPWLVKILNETSLLRPVRTLPLLWRTTLKRPPESLPAPSIRWMSRPMPCSIARTLCR